MEPCLRKLGNPRMVEVLRCSLEFSVVHREKDCLKAGESRCQCKPWLYFNCFDCFRPRLCENVIVHTTFFDFGKLRWMCNIGKKIYRLKKL